MAYQQYEIYGLQPYKPNLCAWDGSTMLEVYSASSPFLPNGPSYVYFIPNETCVSVTTDCSGYDFSFTFGNACDNSSYYGTCDFSFIGGVYFYDANTNALIHVTQGLCCSPYQILQNSNAAVSGNWPNGTAPKEGDLLEIMQPTSSNVAFQFVWVKN